MSMMLMVKAMQTKVGNPLRKLVLIKLADNANDMGECWPSHQHVADQCEISKTSVRNHIKKLEEMGLLKIERREGPKGNTSNLYHLTLQGMPNAGIGIAGDDTGGIAGDGTRTSHSFEPVKEPNNIDRAFEVFWGAGMRKVNKSGALKSFKKAFKDSEETRVDVFASKLAMDVSARLKINQFGFDKMHPTTYLNQQRWNDEYAEHQQSTNATSRKLTAEEERNKELLAKYGNPTAQAGWPEHTIADTGVDQHQVQRGVSEQVEPQGVTIDMDSGDWSPND